MSVPYMTSSEDIYTRLHEHARGIHELSKAASDHPSYPRIKNELWPAIQWGWWELRRRWHLGLENRYLVPVFTDFIAPYIPNFYAVPHPLQRDRVIQSVFQNTTDAITNLPELNRAMTDCVTALSRIHLSWLDIVFEYGNDICGDVEALSQLANLARIAEGDWTKLNQMRLLLHQTMEKRHQNSIEPPTMKLVDIKTVEEQLIESHGVFYGFPS